ncbi:7 transmembrane receptor (rhodopsin family) domain-containing protein [Phthorimaea operculella]|nr:7 transmembrane receptor (rhodopsin family) domain-containing protein [Phthorimaea operculella]
MEEETLVESSTIDITIYNTSDFYFPNELWHIKSPKEIAIKTSVMLFIAIPGLYMNFIILVVLIKNRYLWTPSFFLVGNLALIDFLTLLLCPWFMLVRDFYQNYVLKNFGCRFEGFMQVSFLLANVLAVILVSYDRLAAAVLPTEARITKKAAPKLIVGSWFIALVFSIPWIVHREYIERQWSNHLESFCAEDPRVLRIYWQFTLILVVWLPLSIMLFTYAGIIWRLERSARKLSSRGGGQLVARAKARTMRVAAGVLLADFICRNPYSVLVYKRNEDMDDEDKINWVDGPFAVLWFVANTLMLANCTINPLIYGFTNNRLLKAMDRTPGVACCKFGSWCCVCASNSKKELRLQQDKNTEKIFVIEASPKPKRKISRLIKNMLHINADALDLNTHHLEELTTKPTKITPCPHVPEHNTGEVENKNDNVKDDKSEEDKL